MMYNDCIDWNSLKWLYVDSEKWVEKEEALMLILKRKFPLITKVKLKVNIIITKIIEHRYFCYDIKHHIYVNIYSKGFGSIE